MKIVVGAVGILLILAGFVFVLDGLGLTPAILPGMRVTWTGWGAFALAFGAGAMVWVYRRISET
jgi:hypothetical protein